MEVGSGSSDLLSTHMVVALHLYFRSSRLVPGSSRSASLTPPLPSVAGPGAELEDTGLDSLLLHQQQKAVGNGFSRQISISLFHFLGNCAEYIITLQEFSFNLPKYHLLPRMKWRLLGGKAVDTMCSGSALFPLKSFTYHTGEGLESHAHLPAEVVPLRAAVSFAALLPVFSRNEAVL